MTFECDKCGICCQHIDGIPQLRELNTGNGRCIHLSEDNLCKIYLNRPDVCNVEKMYELYFMGVISVEKYICLNKKGCEDLKNKYM